MICIQVFLQNVSLIIFQQKNSGVGNKKEPTDVTFKFFVVPDTGNILSSLETHFWRNAALLSSLWPISWLCHPCHHTSRSVM